jgi:tRNA G18 (ribose-2'-O)-methylase SpoU
VHMNERNFAYRERAVDDQLSLKANFGATRQKKAGIIDSLLHPLAILIRQVLTRAGRMELNLILIDDQENIMQALNAGIVIHSLYYSGGEMFSSELIHKLPANVRIYEIAKRTCKKLFENDKVVRFFAIAHTPVMAGLESLLDVRLDIVVLENLTISGNIGAIVRSSLAFGAGAIVLLNAEPVDVYDRRVIRASRGYIFSIPVVTATTEEFIRFCNEKGLSMVAMTVQAESLIQEAATIPAPLAIVFGSEKEGGSPILLDAATLRVQIPTHTRVESLNVSTAAGIVLYNRLWFNQPRTEK